MQSSTHTITLEKLTYGGDAMGRLPDGRAVFIPFGLPGERVRIRLTEQKQNFARGELMEIIDSSPDRIAPKCKHFFSLLSYSGEGPGVRACGGCHYQNLAYEKQLAFKTEVLRDQLLRIGKIQAPPVAPMVPSPLEWNYRNHVQFHLTQSGELGFVAASSANEDTGPILALAECHLPEESINAAWPQLEFDPGADVERVSLRVGADDNLMLLLESEEPYAPELEIEAGISVTHVFEEHTVILAGNDHIFIEVKGRPFKVSATSFFQVNTAMAEKMVDHLLACLPITPNDALLDLYCGVGLFSAFFASRVKRLIGIESSASACEDFTANLDEFDNVELYEGPAEEILPVLIAQIANLPYAIADPPRSGLDRRVLDALIQLQPRIIAYVSCDPSTLARDARRLIEGGYALRQVTPFDLFPQTYHIESISLFEWTR